MGQKQTEHPDLIKKPLYEEDKKYDLEKTALSRHLGFRTCIYYICNLAQSNAKNRI